MIVDTHCHILSEYYDDIAVLMKEIEKKDIILIISGVNPISNKEVIELTKKYKNVYGTVGFHPSEVDLINENDFLELEAQLKHNKILGVGEIGLDYYWIKDNKEKQKAMFIKQLNIAQKNNYSVVIHNREATEDILNILSNYKLKGVIHAFSKGIEVANNFIKSGYKLGIGGVLTFKNSNLKQTLKDVPLDCIVVETDSPYLTPEPFRGKLNSPLYIENIIDKISEIKGQNPNVIKENLYNNTIQIFDFNK